MEIREIQRDELPQLLALYRHLHPDGWLEEGPDAQKIWQAIQAARAITSWWRKRGESWFPPVPCSSSPT